MQNGKDIAVSVQCITYNHEKYIRKALDGFVMQRTTFPFEVIVHDDASTDGTARIVREYVDKYPFIHAVLQTENQHSKKIDLLQKYVYPLIKGRYVAVCEGDDYWTDPYKLQTMYDYMSAHDECSMCCHAYENIEANSEKVIEEIHTLQSDGTVTIQKAIKYDNPTQLASQMYRRDCIIDKPDIFLGRGIGDYTVLLYAATLGEIHYIDRVMARHRVAADGSWTNRVYKNRELKIAHFEKMIDFLHDFDEYTMTQYHDDINEKIEDYNFRIMMAANDFVSQKKHPAFKVLPLKRKILVSIGVLFPSLVGTIIDKHDFH